MTCHKKVNDETNVLVSVYIRLTSVVVRMDYRPGGSEFE